MLNPDTLVMRGLSATAPPNCSTIQQQAPMIRHKVRTVFVCQVRARREVWLTATDSAQIYSNSEAIGAVSRPRLAKYEEALKLAPNRKSSRMRVRR
jgi:hypothetical protein